MRYYINQKFFALVKEDFTIMDEAGNPIYKVLGQAFWSGKKLRIFDMNDNLLFILNRRLLTYLINIDIKDANKNRLARFREKFHIGFKRKYGVVTEEGNRYGMEGNFFGTDYRIFREFGTKQEPNNVDIAVIGKDFIQLSDKYCLNVLDDSESMMCLAIMLCVDMARATKAKQSNNSI